MACGFQGNADIYGIGIRIGYYTQAFSLWFANFFLLREAKHLRGINNFFVFALGIAGSIYAYNARNTYAVEAFLLLQIAICIGAASVMDNTRYSSRYLRRSEQSLLLRTITVNAGLIFNLCYWWRGLDLMKPTPCTNGQPVPAPTEARMDRHQTYVCYLIKTNLYGWLRIVMKVGAVAALINYVLTCTARDLTEAIQTYKLRSSRSTFVKHVAALGTHELLEPEAGWVMEQSHDNEKVNAAIQDVSHDCSAGTSTSPSQPPRQVSDEGNLIIEAVSQEQTESSCSSEPKPLTGNADSSSAMVNDKLSMDRRPMGPEIFLQIERAESYLNTIFHTPEIGQEVHHKQKTVHKTGRFFNLGALKLKWRDVSPSRMMSHVGCCLRIILENDPPAELRWRLSFHMTASGRYPHAHALKYLYRMRELNAIVQPPDWRTLAIASDVQLSQIPLIVTPSVWAWEAVQKLIVFMILVIQVELTIVWNHVDGLRSLSSLGQLIPFVLGVGGLLKILWTKWCLVRKGIGEDFDAKFRPVSAYEEAILRYLEWSKQVQKPMKSVSPNTQTSVVSSQYLNPPIQEQSQA